MRHDDTKGSDTEILNLKKYFSQVFPINRGGMKETIARRRKRSETSGKESDTSSQDVWKILIYVLLYDFQF